MDFYSRMVAFLKVLLPLAALGILSTLFLLSRSIDPTANIPFSEKDVTERIRGQQVTKPFFSGTTAKGDDIIVQARVARPGGPGKPAEAEDVTARMISPDGVRIDVRSDVLSVDFDREAATFAGNVRIRSSAGMEVITDRLEAETDRVAGRTPGEVRATGPMGDLTAGRMAFEELREGGPIHMVFKGGVKLVYDPAEQKE
ncbi:hypothetical protein [Jhaorihella thermophila]|uniref:Lipopolysaccharide export system protein LptC n=1 Tax=Jhaorihella thermophila TaxID=488547 RepID=A0A1H5VKU0_9RHOB|nr:hypothetical protein [Jhaorihella thermophila]SEF87942.1 lipopolysaccharide export system protein LptC [Jhaorihella thermophila]